MQLSNVARTGRYALFRICDFVTAGHSLADREDLETLLVVAQAMLIRLTRWRFARFYVFARCCALGTHRFQVSQFNLRCSRPRNNRPKIDRKIEHPTRRRSYFLLATKIATGTKNVSSVKRERSLAKQ